MKIILSGTITGPEAPSAAPSAAPECVRFKQQTNQTSCFGGKDLLDQLLAIISGLPAEQDDSLNFKTSIWAQDLAGSGYNVQPTHGTISKKKEKKNLTQTLFVSSKNVLNRQLDIASMLEFMPDIILSATWSGTVYDNAGTAIAWPAVTIKGDYLLLDPVNGRIKISYQAWIDVIDIDISPRKDPQNNYASSLIGFADCGQPLNFAIQVPGCVQSKYSYRSDPYGFEDLIDDSDVTIDKEVPGADKYQDLDLCTGIVA